MIKLGYLKVKNEYDLNDENLKRLSHVNLSFAKVVDINGTVEFDACDEQKLQLFRSQNPEMKISLAIGGWGAGNFSEAVASAENRSNFIKTTMAIIEKYKLNGVDIDWEYPCCDDSGISSSPNDKVNFTKLMRELRSSLDQLGKNDGQNYILTFAAGANEKLISCVELEALYEITDFMNLMTYDMGGSFGVSGYHASLYPTEQCSNKGGAYFVDLYDNAGYKKDKIVYGAAFYGRGGNDVAGINQPINGEEGLYFDYHDIAKQIASGDVKVHYDEQAKGAYIYDGFTFMSFDTAKSIEAKIDYVAKQKLLGIMFWEYATDNTGELLNTIINYQPEN